MSGWLNVFVVVVMPRGSDTRKPLKEQEGNLESLGNSDGSIPTTATRRRRT